MTSTHDVVSGTPTTERLPIAALAALFTAGFITTLTEALPAGVLPQMSHALAVSESVGGQTVTIYAVATMLTAIPLSIVTSSWPRRRLLVIALIGFLVANLVTAISLDYTVTMIARFIAGAASGVTWSILGGYAQKLVGPALKGRAMAVAFAGTPVALSLGVPVGAFLGQVVGWQLTFGIITALSALLIGWSLWKLPDFPGQKLAERLPVLHLLRLKGLRTILVVTGLYVLAHTVLYTYIAPVLAGVGLEAQVQWILLDFGIASILSIWLTGVFVDRHHRRLVILSTVLFAVAATALSLDASSPIVDYIAVGFWGLAFGGAATLFQSALMAASGDHADAAQPLQVTMWNAGIGLGGLIGGVLLAGFGTESILVAVALMVAATVLIVVVARRHAFPHRR
ncbi:MFS transporter [Schumannella luteola]|uniref:Putative MFS family arabinose efflux permease n=1 Tax=Schumannella luteola TaxID=472059 RepID=A0A852Y8R0_9MICO|nr:MFS transporter [Schumannella luteola]NYG97611.1 putative MFS family arabinose efflux permease [Schumannella luteola]TPX04666.1 MFS transporter [Schumannella luteola]